MHSVDEKIFLWINGWSDRFAPFWTFFTDATDLLWVRIVLAIMVIGMIAGGKGTRRTILLTLLAWPLANAITDVLKAQIPRARPFQVPDLFPLIHMRAGMSDSFGTASAHSANMAAIAFVFAYYLRWWSLPWVFIAFVTGVSRIYVGVHYPSQVLLGWLCGMFAGLVVVKTWDAFFQRRKSRTPEEV